MMISLSMTSDKIRNEPVNCVTELLLQKQFVTNTELLPVVHWRLWQDQHNVIKGQCVSVSSFREYEQTSRSGLTLHKVDRQLIRIIIYFRDLSCKVSHRFLPSILSNDPLSNLECYRWCRRVYAAATGTISCYRQLA